MVHRTMLNAASVVSLTFLLAIAVYVLVRKMGTKLGAVRIGVLATGAAALASWLLLPGLTGGADLELPLLVRRIGVASGGAGAAFAYLAVRREERPAGVLALLAPVFIGISGFLAPANWIAGTGACLIAAAAAPDRTR